MSGMPNCNNVRPRVDELLHGELPPADIAACERHIGECAECAAALADAEALQMALLSMPVPELRPGFAAEALAVARRQHMGPADAAPAEAARVVELRRPRRLRPDSWWGALGGALAAGILLVALWGLPGGTPVEDETSAGPAEFRLALFEPRDITIAIDTAQALPGARLTVRVDGGIELVGFGDTRELSWEADLEEGTNTLSLPVLAHSLEQGRLTTLVEHGQRRQQIELAIRADAPAGE